MPAAPDREVYERKLGFLKQYLSDLAPFAARNHGERLAAHYTIERLLQLLCEAAADIAIQVVKAEGLAVPDSYRETFGALAARGLLPDALAARLVDACAMRNVLTHLYDGIDVDRVVKAVEPAVALYGEYLAWAVSRSYER